MLQQLQSEPAKPWAERLGEYRFLPSGTVLKALTGGTVSEPSISSKIKAAPRSSSQTTRTGTTLSTFTDSAGGQQAKIESGEAAKLTPLDLQNASIAASRRIVETRSTRGNTKTKYKVHSNSQAVFKLGSVIELLYPEYSGGDSAITPTREYGGEWRMRRFVIIEPRPGCSACLPLSTYNGQGVAKRGVVKQHHVIIYTGQTPPAPTAQEGPVRVPSGSVDTLRATPIQVTPAHAGSALDPMSRLNLTEHFVIDHHVEVYLFGSVSPQSITALLYQFRDANTPQHPQYAPERPSAGPSTAAGSRRPAGIQTNGDEPNEDQEVVTLALRVRGFKDPEKARQALANLKRHDEANNRDMYPRVIAYLRRTAAGGTR